MRRNLTPRLRGYRGRRYRRRGRWLIPAVFAALALPAAADFVNGWVKRQGECRVVRVVDGDTLAMSCRGDSATRLRLTGIDTPELQGACLGETVQAFRATWFTRWQLWTASAITIGSEGGRDRYGRALGAVYLDGDSLEDRLLAAGLAVVYVPGQTDWCERIERGLA